MAEKRMVEVFTAGCPLRDETVELVRKPACPSCDVRVYNQREGGMDKAKQYGVNSVPTVVVDGTIVACVRAALNRQAGLRDS